MSGNGCGVGGFPYLVRTFVKGTTIIFAGSFALAVACGTAVRYSARVAQLNGFHCTACRGKGFYSCKLCKGKSTIEWSPMYDPVVINPCLCPTCDGHKIQRCLNCLGIGST